jgi:subtilisin family serine protease
MEKEYNVILRKGVDYDQFGNDMVNITNKDGIPNREIEVANSRLGSYRQTHYYLTDEEAQEVRNHPDVLEVEIPPENRDDIIIANSGRLSGTFTKSPGTVQAHINYALLRSKSKTNNYGTGTELAEDYLYNLDGTGVDVVIQDSGIQADHPEWQDPDGTSRLKQINWGTASGLGFTQSSQHYTDYHGHGTHVASTVAGKTFGWAKNANIYALKVSGFHRQLTLLDMDHQ